MYDWGFEEYNKILEKLCALGDVEYKEDDYDVVYDEDYDELWWQ